MLCQDAGGLVTQLVGVVQNLFVCVDLCVLCACLWLCFLCGSNFSYHTGRMSTLAKAKWPIFVHSYHKIGPQTLQI
jgi:hypothetical protein